MTPPGSLSGSSQSSYSSSEDEEGNYPQSTTKDIDQTSSDSGFKNMWRRAKDLVKRLESESKDSELSSSEEEEEEVETMRRSHKSQQEEDEGVHSKGSDK